MEHFRWNNCIFKKYRIVLIFYSSTRSWNTSLHKINQILLFITMAILIIKISSKPTWEERQGGSMFLSPCPSLCEATIHWIQIWGIMTIYAVNTQRALCKRHSFHLNLWTILERRMKTSSSANLLPTHMRVPWPKGRLTKGWTDCWKQKIHLRWHNHLLFNSGHN